MNILEVKISLDRKYGAFFTLVFQTKTMHFMWNDAIQLSIVIGSLATTSTLITIINDGLLLPANKLWMRLGLLLSTDMSPIVSGAIFFFLFTPIAFLMRLIGRDELRLRKREAKSYWKPSEPIRPNGDFFKHQF